MKIRATVRDARWQYVSALLDARFLLLLLFLLVLFGNAGVISRSAMARAMDDGLFRLGVKLQGKSVGNAAGYARIDVPGEEMQRFLHDPASAADMMAFLAQLQASSMKGAALVLHDTLWTEYRLNELLEHNYLANSAVPSDVLRIASNRMATYRSLVANEKILRTHIVEGEKPSRSILEWLASKSITPFYRVQTDTLGMEVPQMHYGQLERPLLLTDKKITRPDARLALFALQQNVRNPAWQPGQGFMIQGALLATSPNAEVLPFFSVDSGFAVPATIRYSLSVMKDQAALRILQNKIVVIGQENDADADDLLLNVLSLEHANFVLPAAAFSWIHLGVTTIVFVFLLLMPFVAFRVSALLSALLLVSFILGQQIFFSVHREWLPVSQWILFLVTGYVWMALWCIKQSSIAAPSIAQPVIPPRSGTKESKKRFSLNVFKKNGNPIRTRIQPTMEGMRAAEATFDSDSSLSFTTAERSTVGISAATNAGGMPQHLGRYQIVRELGRGAMGVVYLAFDPKISRQIAIKTLHYNQFDAAELPTIKERFFSEARAAGNLKHEHIVTIHDAGEEQDLAYVAMDYVDGVALSAHTHKGDLLDVELVYYIMAMAADAVYSAHSKGIIHRDIKPSNILYDPKTNEVKVADFGIARIMNASVTRTRTGDLLGSPLYMSPEQIRGEKVTTQTDIFSLGVTFYQLLTGELPFKADNIANLTYQIVQCKYTPVDEIRPELPISAKRIITKALQKNPANRYASAAEMQRALQDAYSKDFS